VAVLGVDVGGTFTDAVLIDGGELRTAKVATAARQLGQMRLIVATNLVLGLITAAIGASGRYWG